MFCSASRCPIRLGNTSDKEEDRACVGFERNERVRVRAFDAFALELAVSDEDKRCYACKEADEECVAPCHWTQRCYMKAKHANATGLFSTNSPRT